MAKALLMRAWREGWSPEKFSSQLRGALTPADIRSLPEVILRQATIGSAANHTLISYMQHLTGSQVVSFAEMTRALVQLEEALKPACMLSLIDLLKIVLNSQRMPYNCGDDSLEYASAVANLTSWLQRVVAYVLARVLELLAVSPTSSSTTLAALTVWTTIGVEACQLGELLLRQREHVLLILIHSRLTAIGSNGGLPSVCSIIHDTATSLLTSIGQLPAAVASTEILATKARAFVAACHRLEQSLDDTLANDGPLLADPGLVIGILVHIEAQLNASANVRKFAARLKLIGRLQRMSSVDLYCELVRACLIGLVDSSEKDKKAWVVFTFIKLPSILSELVQVLGDAGNGFGVGNDAGVPQLELAVRRLQTYEVLLSSAEAALAGADVWQELLTAVFKKKLLSEQMLNEVASRRTQQKASSSPARSESPSQIGNMVLRVQEKLDNVIKHFTACLRTPTDTDEISGIPEADLSSKAAQLVQFVHQNMLGQNLDLFTMAACCSGQLASFVNAILRVNELCLQVAATGVSIAADDARLHFFDLTFLMLCRIALSPYGAELFGDGSSLTERHSSSGSTFFVSWVRTALFGIVDSGTSAISNVDASKAEGLKSRLFSSGSSRPLSLREACVCSAHTAEQVATTLAAALPQGQDNVFKSVIEHMRAMSAAIPVIVTGILCSRAAVLADGQRRAVTILLNGFLEPINSDGILPVVQTKMDLMHSTIVEIVQKYHLTRVLGLSLSPVQREQVQDEVLAACSAGGDSLALTFSKAFDRIYEKGRPDGTALRTLLHLRQVNSSKWFSLQLINVLLPRNATPYVEDAAKAVAVLFAVSHIDLEQLTFAICTYVIPAVLQRCTKPFALTEPKCQAVAQYSMWCLLAQLDYGQDPDIYSPDVTAVLMELHQEEKLEVQAAFASRQHDMHTTGVLTQCVVAHLLKVLRCVTRGGMLSQRTHFVNTLVQACCTVGKPYSTAFLKQLPVEMAAEVLEDCGSSFLPQYVDSQLERFGGSSAALRKLANLCCLSLQLATKGKTNSTAAHRVEH